MTNNGMQNKKCSYSKGGRFFSAFSSVIGTLGVIVIILMCLPVTVPSFVGYGIYNVVSGSMEPAMPIGSVVYTKQEAPDALVPGDVIAYQLNGTVITHRVMENNIPESQLITKGDANPDVDMDPVRYGQVIGKVQLHLPFLGGFYDFFTSVNGKIRMMIFLVISFIFLMIGSSVKDKIRKQEAEQRAAERKEAERREAEKKAAEKKAEKKIESESENKGKSEEEDGQED